MRRFRLAAAAFLALLGTSCRTARIVGAPALAAPRSLDAYVADVGRALVERSTRQRVREGAWRFEVREADVAVSRAGYVVAVRREEIEGCQDEEELAGLLAYGLAEALGETTLSSPPPAVREQMGRALAQMLGGSEKGKSAARLLVAHVSDEIERRAARLGRDANATTLLAEAGYDARGWQRYLYCRPSVSGDPSNIERADRLERDVAAHDATLDRGARDARAAQFRAILGRRE